VRDRVERVVYFGAGVSSMSGVGCVCKMYAMVVLSRMDFAAGEVCICVVGGATLTGGCGMQYATRPALDHHTFVVCIV